MYSFKEYLNEINIKGKAIGKPIWNRKDYLTGDGSIGLEYMNLTELPCIFPEVWDKSFYCGYNNLTSLEGAPKEVGGVFSCMNNQLTSLEGAPGKVGKSFRCNNNKLTSLEGAPKEVGWDFNCAHNTTKFTKEDVKEICEVKGNTYA